MTDTFFSCQIRAAREQPRFERDGRRRLELSQRARYGGYAASQWLELRLQLIGVTVVAAVAFISVVQHHTAAGAGGHAGYVGLAVSYALGITGKLSGLLSSFTETEREFVAVERVQEYAEGVEGEDGLDFEEKEGHDDEDEGDWPSEGEVTFQVRMSRDDRKDDSILYQDVQLRYRDHLPLALKGTSFKVNPGEKVNASKPGFNDRLPS